jgi:hypothetical protein
MRTVAEYKALTERCHDLAAMLTDPKAKLATELMASAWEKAAKKRKAQLKQQPFAAFRSIAAALFLISSPALPRSSSRRQQFCNRPPARLLLPGAADCGECRQSAGAAIQVLMGPLPALYNARHRA